MYPAPPVLCITGATWLQWRSFVVRSGVLVGSIGGHYVGGECVSSGVLAGNFGGYYENDELLPCIVYSAPRSCAGALSCS